MASPVIIKSDIEKDAIVTYDGPCTIYGSVGPGAQITVNGGTLMITGEVASNVRLTLIGKSASDTEGVMVGGPVGDNVEINSYAGVRLSSSAGEKLKVKAGGDFRAACVGAHVSAEAGRHISLIAANTGAKFKAQGFIEIECVGPQSNLRGNGITAPRKGDGIKRILPAFCTKAAHVTNGSKGMTMLTTGEGTTTRIRRPVYG